METHELQDGEWIAVQVRCGFEKTVSEGLQQRGYEQFFRSYHKERRSRGSQIETVQRPLFPGYVFCRYIRVPHYRILATPAVIRLVGAGNMLISIPEIEIEAIRRVVNSGLYNEPWKFLQVGQAVVVNRGPLCGVRGTLVSVCRGMRLLVSIGLLGRAVAVEVDAETVSPIGSFNAPEYMPSNACLVQ
jgi:transcriptional antiterminator NusG